MKKLMSLLLAGLLLATAAATAAAPYANNRAPLREKPFVKLPLGAIRAEGWLRDQLQRQADGLTGHLDSVYPEVMGPRNGWLGGDGDQWERGPYWIDGLLPLAWLVFHIGFRVHTVGRENLRKVQTKGCIIAPNHVSAIDPVFIVISRFWGRRMLVFAKKELFEINALLTWFFRCSGALCVRGTKEELEIIDRTVEACRAGETLLIFPEGTREKEGRLLPPKSGLFVIAAQAGVDVVPVRIRYDTPDGKMRLFCRVNVIYGEPMPAAQFAMESRRDMKVLRANKQALLDAWEQLN